MFSGSLFFRIDERFVVAGIIFLPVNDTLTTEHFAPAKSSRHIQDRDNDMLSRFGCDDAFFDLVSVLLVNLLQPS